ncbi:MAG: hypothetical protein AAGF06_02575 [Pseudomonadota bacterium]
MDKQDEPISHRDYCLLIDGSKHNRNLGCKKHDNAYGINGGGGASERKIADRRFYEHLKSNNDPVAPFAYAAVRLFGWFFFNYKQGVWRGQLSKRLFKGLL